MSDFYILNDDGEPLRAPLLVWAEWFEATAVGDTRAVARDTAAPGVEVSTAFIGLDMSFGFGGPPLLYETMVFGGPCNGETMRYPTKADAVAGHADMLARVRLADLVDAATPPDEPATP